MTKKASEPACKPGERLYFDTAGPYSTSLGGSTYWVMAVDDHTRYKFSGFVKEKSDIGSFATEVLKKVKAAGKICSLRQRGREHQAAKGSL